MKRWTKRRDKLEEKIDAESQMEVAAADKRINSIQGHILASYLRDTHTEDDQVRRIRHWLDAIKDETGDDNVFRYGVGGKDYQRELALIGISHGRGAPWLRKQLINDGPDDRFFQPVATGESANLAFPGLLLRLADIMDFDASRAPQILFKHFGIENDQSVLEWNKHLSVTGWRLDIDPNGKQQPSLLYSAECTHPVHEKAIREFTFWIDAELSAVRTELDAERRQLPAADQDRYDLHLPSQARLDIRPTRDPLTDHPKYVFRDLQFRLNQDEIQQLLMGESLYGDPGLCIRELLQNGLDALELRELRLKMKQKGEGHETVDGELICPGWVREPDGREEELRITLSWGADEETGQQWLRVTDNGVGMTEEVIKKYFTQIGKSYYRSPEFNRERAAMKAVGELISPISIFGIGILSCFMIAERVEVRTQPDGDDRFDRTSRDVAISGPGSLFWIRRGTRESSGTDITLFLKSRFEIELDKEKPSKKKQRESAQPSQSDERITVNPLEITETYVAWPRYPVEVFLGKRRVLRVTQTSPIDKLRIRRAEDSDESNRSIVSEKILKALNTWAIPLESIGTLSWGTWEWTDDASDEATGTRLMLLFPLPDESRPSQCFPADTHDGKMRQDVWASVIQSVQPRETQVLVNGMKVQEMSGIAASIGVRAAVGTGAWIDLRGAACPRLTVDRRRAFPPINAKEWRRTIEAVFRRARKALSATIAGQPMQVYRNILVGFSGTSLGGTLRKLDLPATAFNLVSAYRPVTGQSVDDPIHVELAYVRFVQSLGLSLRDDDLRRLIEPIAIDRGELRRVFDLKHHWIDTEPRLARERAVTLALQCGNPVELEFALNEDIDFRDDPQGAVEIHERQEFDGSFVHRYAAFRLALIGSLLQEAFYPSLESSWPSLGLFTLKGQIGNAVLSGPGLVDFEFTADGRTVQFSDPQGKTPAELVERGYDLIFPMTTVPLGQLRRHCAAWRTDRWVRPLGIAPFLLPSLHEIWTRHTDFLQEKVGVPHIYCLFPRFELWSKRFSDWTNADWNDPENLSALWDLSGHLTGTPGRVVWSRGTHHIKDVPKLGVPATRF